MPARRTAAIRQPTFVLSILASLHSSSGFRNSALMQTSFHYIGDRELYEYKCALWPRMTGGHHGRAVTVSRLVLVPALGANGSPPNLRSNSAVSRCPIRQ